MNTSESPAPPEARGKTQDDDGQRDETPPARGFRWPLRWPMKFEGVADDGR